MKKKWSPSKSPRFFLFNRSPTAHRQHRRRFDVDSTDCFSLGISSVSNLGLIFKILDKIPRRNAILENSPVLSFSLYKAYIDWKSQSTLKNNAEGYLKLSWPVSTCPNITWHSCLDLIWHAWTVESINGWRRVFSFNRFWTVAMHCVFIDDANGRKGSKINDIMSFVLVVNLCYQHKLVNEKTPPVNHFYFWPDMFRHLWICSDIWVCSDVY